MPTVSALNVAPVKSLGLLSAGSVYISSRGIEGDRQFVVLDGSGRVVTQRQLGSLTQVTAKYSAAENALKMTFPDGSVVEGHPESTESTATMLWGRVVEGSLIGGRWAEALSEFCGAELRLFESYKAGACFDEYPVSIISQASIDHLTGLTGGRKIVRGRNDSDRRSCWTTASPTKRTHGWARESGIGERLRMRLIARDPRCAITTLGSGNRRARFRHAPADT